LFLLFGALQELYPIALSVFSAIVEFSCSKLRDKADILQETVCVNGVIAYGISLEEEWS